MKDREWASSPRHLHDSLVEAGRVRAVRPVPTAEETKAPGSLSEQVTEPVFRYSSRMSLAGPQLLTEL